MRACEANLGPEEFHVVLIGKQTTQAIKRSIPTFDHFNRPCAPARDQ